jgi:peptidoglycan/xylan/chitin deacetylase (PgdA/CDA1 family)
MHIVVVGDAPEVALTLDACSGSVDDRILDVLVANKIPATIFATGRWLSHNSAAVKTLVSHPDLFEIEDHGANHIPAVIGTIRPYGLKPAGTAAAVEAEVAGGASAILGATGVAPIWYRGAAALYTRDAIDLVDAMGMKVAGFSLNADLGATASETLARTRVAAARSGDVLIAHLNQPHRAAGSGVAEGILDLLEKGFRFVRLSDVAEKAD